jgi:hypothetical protein
MSETHTIGEAESTITDAHNITHIQRARSRFMYQIVSRVKTTFAVYVRYLFNAIRFNTG